MPLVIARTSHDDLTLRALHIETLPADTYPEWAVGEWWLALDGADPVGFAGLQPSRQWCDAAYLVRCGVLPSHRGRGLQRRLLLAREKHARVSGLRWLVTSTLNNPASANSLIGRGYRMYEPSIPWGARGTIYWRKCLER